MGNKFLPGGSQILRLCETGLAKRSLLLWPVLAVAPVPLECPEVWKGVIANLTLPPSFSPPLLSPLSSPPSHPPLPHFHSLWSPPLPVPLPDPFSFCVSVVFSTLSTQRRFYTPMLREVPSVLVTLVLGAILWLPPLRKSRRGAPPRSLRECSQVWKLVFLRCEVGRSLRRSFGWLCLVTCSLSPSRKTLCQELPERIPSPKMGALPQGSPSDCARV